MNHYQKYNIILSSILGSKSQSRVNIEDTTISEITISAGPYKPTNFYKAHLLVFNSVVGKPAEIKYQTHGKREKRTILIFTKYKSNSLVTEFISRFVNTLLPSVLDLRTIKNIKRTRETSVTMFRLRKRFGISFPDCDEFITDELYDTKRGIALPLSVGLKFKYKKSYIMIEDLLRMNRFPLTFFRWWPYSAVDDEEIIGYGYYYD